MSHAVPPEPAQACTDEVCITCSDQGIEATVVAPPEGPWDLATVNTATGLEQVDVTTVGPVKPGQRLLIHAGMAIAALGPGIEQPTFNSAAAQQPALDSSATQQPVLDRP
jgi:hydrogenase maturation factor